MNPVLITLAGNRNPHRTPATMRMSGEAVNFHNDDIIVGYGQEKNPYLTVDAMNKSTWNDMGVAPEPVVDGSTQLQTINTVQERDFATAHINDTGLDLKMPDEQALYNSFTSLNVKTDSAKSFDIATALQDPKVLAGIAAGIIIVAYMLRKE
jgi:hypothetical protein